MARWSRMAAVAQSAGVLHTGVFSKHTFGLLRRARNLGILLSILEVDNNLISGPVF